jgi:hypothetical protein
MDAPVTFLGASVPCLDASRGGMAASLSGMAASMTCIDRHMGFRGEAMSGMG